MIFTDPIYVANFFLNPHHCQVAVLRAFSINSMMKKILSIAKVWNYKKSKALTLRTQALQYLSDGGASQLFETGFTFLFQAIRFIFSFFCFSYANINHFCCTFCTSQLLASYPIDSKHNCAQELCVESSQTCSTSTRRWCEKCIHQDGSHKNTVSELNLSDKPEDGHTYQITSPSQGCPSEDG